MAFPRAHVFALLAALAGSACFNANSLAGLNYGERAEAEYQRAVRMLDAGDYQAAVELLAKIDSEYRYSRWGWLASLRLGDSDYRQEKYAEAIGRFRSWIRYHPTQPEVVYARFMISKCYVKEMPTDWLLVPAAFDRDQSASLDAEDQLVRFLADFPTSEYAAEARNLLKYTREMLAHSEMSISDYYLSRGRPQAATARLRALLDTYGGSGIEPEVLLKLGEIYLLMDRPVEAVDAFDRILNQFPRSVYVQAAQNYLAHIRRSHPDLNASEP